MSKDTSVLAFTIKLEDFEMSKFYEVLLSDITKDEMNKALEQITFIRNTTRAGIKLIKPLSIAIACMEKYQSEMKARKHQ